MSWVIVVATNEANWIPYRAFIERVRTLGKWTHDIVCLSLPDLAKREDFNTFNQVYRVESKEFDPIDIERLIIRNENMFKFQKLHVFDEYFKKWDWIFYIDVKCRAQHDLNRFCNLSLNPSYIHGHSDPYPTYTTSLENQFLDIEPFISELKELGSLKINFFQSIVFIFASSLIEAETKSDLMKIVNRFPIASTEEQGALAIYFCLLSRKWKQLPICDEHGYLYDYWARYGIPKEKYVLLATE